MEYTIKVLPTIGASSDIDRQQRRPRLDTTTVPSLPPGAQYAENLERSSPADS